MTSKDISPALLKILRNPIWLWVEFGLIFFAVPSLIYFHSTQGTTIIGMWSAATYCLVSLCAVRDFSWRTLWHGDPWPLIAKKKALVRYCAMVPALIALSFYLSPERLFGFPREHFGFWLLVMVLYPILSCIPQELVFRSFFFRRYMKLFRQPQVMMAMSAVVFGFVHIIFHNFVSPVLCLIGGIFFASSYRQHRSLKWASIEHALYGCTVFTIGLGTYFFSHGAQL